MPELPDVETFRRKAEQHFHDRTVKDVEIVDAASVTATPVAGLQRRLSGRTLTGARRHGKYLFLNFGEDTTLAMHFGPTGALLIMPASAGKPRFTRLRIHFDTAGTLAYTDRRRIGHVQLVSDARDFVAKLRLGIDAIDPHLDTNALASRLAGRRRPIKLLLMDQSQIAGIGNTYSDEILFQARLHPVTSAGNLSPEQISSLLRAVRRVLRVAIAHDPTEEAFRAHLPAGFLLPQRHTGGHCPRCGHAVEQLRLSGHTATFCPHCQPPLQVTTSKVTSA